MDNMLIFSVEK